MAFSTLVGSRSFPAGRRSHHPLSVRARSDRLPGRDGTLERHRGRPGGRTASTTSGGSRLHTRIDRHADTTPFRHSFFSNSTNPSNYVTQYHTRRQIPQNRPQTARSTMAPISRGGQPTLDDAPKKIAVSRTVSRSSRHIAILSWRSRTPPTIGETGLLISVDRPRWSGARE